MSSPISTGPPALHGLGALLSLAVTALGGGGLVAAWLKWSAARSSTPAQRQETLNDAFSALTKDLQEERAWLTVRVSELERERAELLNIVDERTGRIRGLEQSMASLLTLLHKSGLTEKGLIEKVQSNDTRGI